MVVYPISVPRHSYNGTKENLRRKSYNLNMFAEEIEDHLNKMIEKNDSEIQVYEYYKIARDLNIPIDIVEKLLIQVDGGHNGLTVRKPSR